MAQTIKDIQNEIERLTIDAESARQRAASDRAQMSGASEQDAARTNVLEADAQRFDEKADEYESQIESLNGHKQQLEQQANQAEAELERAKVEMSAKIDQLSARVIELRGSSF